MEKSTSATNSEPWFCVIKINLNGTDRQPSPGNLFASYASAVMHRTVRSIHPLGEHMAEAKELTGPEGMKKIGELIADIRFAMLTTVAADRTLDSRPMATQKTEFDGVLWFLTAAASRKTDEIAENANVSLIYADPDNASYLTVKGHARVLD